MIPITLGPWHVHSTDTKAGGALHVPPAHTVGMGTSRTDVFPRLRVAYSSPCCAEASTGAFTP